MKQRKKASEQTDTRLLLEHEQSAIEYLQECIAIWRDRRKAAESPKLRLECTWQMDRYQRVIDHLLKQGDYKRD